MLRYLLFALLLLHGLIHLVGFISPDTGRPIVTDKTPSILWLGCFVLFLMTSILFLLDKGQWLWIAIASVIFSQFMIVSVWDQARFGTLVNALVLIVVLYFAMAKSAALIFRD